MHVGDYHEYTGGVHPGVLPYRAVGEGVALALKFASEIHVGASNFATKSM